MIIRENIGDFCPSLGPIQMYHSRISRKITTIFMYSGGTAGLVALNTVYYLYMNIFSEVSRLISPLL